MSIPLPYALSTGGWTSAPATVRVPPTASGADVCAAIQADVDAAAERGGGAAPLGTVSHLELVSAAGVAVRVPPDASVFGALWGQ